MFSGHWLLLDWTSGSCSIHVASIQVWPVHGLRRRTMLVVNKRGYSDGKTHVFRLFFINWELNLIELERCYENIDTAMPASGAKCLRAYFGVGIVPVFGKGTKCQPVRQ
eukprot:2136782-Rhodomonas_salina.1